MTRVVDEAGEPVAFGVSLPRPDGWVIDDVCVAAEQRWADAGAALVAGIVERPAVTCVPHADAQQAEVFRHAGWAVVSHYRLLSVAGRARLPFADLMPGLPERLVPEAPSTFQVDPHDEGAIALVDSDGGHIVGSRSFPAPRIYAPGGTTCIVDRIAGPRPERLLAALTAAAGHRGDVQVVVVCRPDDAQRQRILDDGGWRHPVDLFASPT